MVPALVAPPPLVSVIIPCYNHGHFLAEAIESVLDQTWAPLEIIVVDDGSSDTTPRVAQRYPAVVYVWQTNQGLSAARNAGVERSCGDYLLFLDADDWLYPDAIDYNVRQLADHPQAAFVSGAHEKVDSGRQVLSEQKTPVIQEHYLRLLESNYIGMHATVLYRRFVFDTFRFDTSLKFCEDYDLYLNVARRYPVLHHTHPIAAYRIHGANMSGNVPGMLTGVLAVLGRQAKNLQTEPEREAYRRGRRNWRYYYATQMRDQLVANGFADEKSVRTARATLRRYHLTLYIRYWITRLLPPLKRL